MRLLLDNGARVEMDSYLEYPLLRLVKSGAVARLLGRRGLRITKFEDIKWLSGGGQRTCKWCACKWCAKRSN